MAHGIKRGATVLLALQFTPEEWALMVPISETAAKVKVGGSTYSFTTTVDQANRAILLRSETSGWKIGKGELDAMAIHGGVTTLFPQLANVDFPVIQGVTL
ncbi:hypothetical protein [Paracoccus sp. SY]|uniref:hypothetical protein n=1 Tax=Paracoccus sp. SY TaxID=1330255 RepID=UPI000CD26668|nr:hypothetical protein [Paracoccus sp. SY]